MMAVHAFIWPPVRCTVIDRPVTHARSRSARSAVRPVILPTNAHYDQSTSVVCVHVKPRPHQQQCRSNIVECYKSNVASILLPKTATLSKQQATKLPVASTMLLVWTGLKAPSTPATMSKLHSTLLPQTATMPNKYRKISSFDKVETNWTCSICFDFVERTKFRSTMLPKPATLLQKRQQCRSNIRHCRKNRSDCSIRQCCFDIVAGVDVT